MENRTRYDHARASHCFIDQVFQNPSTAVYVTTVCTFLLQCLIIGPTFISNALVVIVIISKRSLQTRTNIIILFLSITDTLTGGVTLPLYITHGFYVLGRRSHCMAFTLAKGFEYIFSSLSVLTLGVVTAERFIAVTRPMTYNAIVTTRRILIILCTLWIITIVDIAFFFNQATSSKILNMQTVVVCSVYIPVVFYMNGRIIKIALKQNRSISSRERMFTNHCEHTVESGACVRTMMDSPRITEHAPICDQLVVEEPHVYRDHGMETNVNPGACVGDAIESQTNILMYLSIDSLKGMSSRVGVAKDLSQSYTALNTPDKESRPVSCSSHYTDNSHRSMSPILCDSSEKRRRYKCIASNTGISFSLDDFRHSDLVALPECLDDSRQFASPQYLDNSKKCTSFQCLDDSRQSASPQYLDDTRQVALPGYLDDSTKNASPHYLDDTRKFASPQCLDDSRQSASPQCLDNSRQAASPQCTKTVKNVSLRTQSRFNVITKKNIREIKVAKTMSLVFGVFVLCFVPTVAMFIIWSQWSHSHEVLFTGWPWADLLMFLNSLANPFIYFWRNKEIRKAVSQLIQTKRCS